MSIFVAIILGLIQGLTEFLPISSSGHLTLAEGLLGVTQGNSFFNVLLHLATLLSVLIVFYKDIINLICHPLKKPATLIYVALIPTFIIGAAIKLFTSHIFSLTFLGFGFLITATLIIICYNITKKQATKSFTPLYNMNYKTAFIIGISQGISTLSGISRSGATITTAQILNTSKENAFKFSFLLSIPVIIASMGIELISCNFKAPPIGFLPCFIGSLVAFITSLLTLKIMMKIAKKSNWLGFSIYLFTLSIIVLFFTFAL